MYMYIFFLFLVVFFVALNGKILCNVQIVRVVQESIELIIAICVTMMKICDSVHERQ